MLEVTANIVASLEDIDRRTSQPAMEWLADILTKPETAVVVTGVGKSYEVARLGASLLRSVGVNAQAIHATDVVHGCIGALSTVKNPVMVGITHSGTTAEVMQALVQSYETNMVTIGITGGAHHIARYTLNYNIKRDGSKHGTIPTVSCMSQLAWLNLIVCTIADRMDREALKAFHPGGSLYEHG